MLGSLILYLKGMRIMMFQLSGFYCIASPSLKAPSARNPPMFLWNWHVGCDKVYLEGRGT